MPGIFPDAAAGGVVIRDIEGNCLNPSNVQQAYCPPESFQTSCLITALPTDCTARITAPQINAFQSEMLCLAFTLNPDGEWNCGSVCNLSRTFGEWMAGTYVGSLWQVVQAHACGSPARDADQPTDTLLFCDGDGNILRTPISGISEGIVDVLCDVEPIDPVPGDAELIFCTGTGVGKAGLGAVFSPELIGDIICNIPSSSPPVSGVEYIFCDGDGNVGKAPITDALNHIPEFDDVADAKTGIQPFEEAAFVRGPSQYSHMYTRRPGDWSAEVADDLYGDTFFALDGVDPATEAMVRSDFGRSRRAWHPLDLHPFMARTAEGMHFFVGPFLRAFGTDADPNANIWRVVFGMGKAHSRQNVDEFEWKLPFDAGSAAFAVGGVVTQAPTLNFEGASATILAISGTTASGVLTLSTPIGVFRDNQPITGSTGGAATVNLPFGRMAVRRHVGRIIWMAESDDNMQTFQNQYPMPGQFYYRISFNNKTSSFTVGQQISGPGGVIAKIRSQTDNGATGQLIVVQEGKVSPDTLAPGTLITDPLGGSATVNGLVIPEDIERDYQGWCMERTGTGRWILMCLALRPEGGPEQHIWMSDDEGQTWPFHEVLASLPFAYFPACVARVPASMGGHDTENLTFFCYGSNQCRLMYTNDNGNTWLFKHYSPPGPEMLSEPTPLIVPGKGLVVVCRDERPATVQPALSLVGPTLTTLGPAVHNGLPLGGNQPIFQQEEDDPYAYLYARSIHTRDTGIGVARFGYVKVVPEDLYDAGGIFPRNTFVDAGPIPQVIQSHFHKAKDERGLWHYICGLEAHPFNSSRPGATGMLVFSPWKPAPVTFGAVRNMAQVPNVFDNAGFLHAPHGTSFNGVNNRVQKLGRWNVSCDANAFANISIGALPVWLHRNAHYNQTNHCRISRSAAGNGLVRLYQRFYGVDTFRYFAGRLVYLECMAFGRCGDILMGISANFGSGGPPQYGDARGVNITSKGRDGLMRISASAGLPDLESKPVALDCFIDVYLQWNMSAGMDLRFFDPSLTFGNYPRPVHLQDPLREEAHLKQFFEVIDFRQTTPVSQVSRVSTELHQGMLDYTPKRARPDISLIGSAPTFADFAVLNTSGLMPATSLTFDAVEKTRARIRVGTAVTTVDAGCLVYDNLDVGKTKILIDAEFPGIG